MVECISARFQRRTPLIRILARELSVNIRDLWRPDAAWLGSYKKAQLAHLMGELRGPAHGAAAFRQKKSELVAELATLFSEAADGRLEETDLAARVNAWLPTNLRDELAALAAANSSP
ncbi:MAG: hypothetical protein H7Y88_04060 [Phycisphaerales bacterium]|nr:hypothetical protein [Phycisphaerales bacterium]